MCLCLSLTKSCPEVGFCFSLCPFAVRWLPHSQSLGDAKFHLLVGIVYVHVGSISGLSFDWKTLRVNSNTKGTLEQSPI